MKKSTASARRKPSESWHPGPWELVHERASKPESYRWPSEDPMCLFFHKPIPWLGGMVERLDHVAIVRSSRKWIAINVAEERLWLRKREIRCMRFDHPPKRPLSPMLEEALAGVAERHEAKQKKAAK